MWCTVFVSRGFVANPMRDIKLRPYTNCTALNLLHSSPKSAWIGTRVFQVMGLGSTCIYSSGKSLN